MFLRKSVSADELLFPSYIDVAGKRFIIKVGFFKKKNSSAVVNGFEINIRLSSKLSSIKAKEHFNSLLSSLIRKIESKPHLHNRGDFLDVLDRKNFMFARELYKIEFADKRGIKLLDSNVIRVNSSLKPDQIQKSIIKLLCIKYEERLLKYVKALNVQTYGFKINNFSLKNANSKWGHCSHDNSIMLNIKLLNADTDILNYVIFHELSHVKHKNHSDKFWKEVARFCPNYKLLRKKLRLNPPEVFEKPMNIA